MGEPGCHEAQGRAGEPRAGGADDDEETADRRADHEAGGLETASQHERRRDELAGTASWMIRINAGYAGVPAAIRTNRDATSRVGEASAAIAIHSHAARPARATDVTRRMRRGSTRTSTAPATGEQITYGAGQHDRECGEPARSGLPALELEGDQQRRHALSEAAEGVHEETTGGDLPPPWLARSPQRRGDGPARGPIRRSPRWIERHMSCRRCVGTGSPARRRLVAVWECRDTTRSTVVPTRWQPGCRCCRRSRDGRRWQGARPSTSWVGGPRSVIVVMCALRLVGRSLLTPTTVPGGTAGCIRGLRNPSCRRHGWTRQRPPGCETASEPGKTFGVTGQPARATAAAARRVRLSRPSLRKMWVMWASTVRRETYRRSAICGLLRPAATRSTTWCSFTVRDAQP